jgi:hypothetical protein
MGRRVRLVVTLRPVLIFVGVPIAIVLTFYGIRIATDARSRSPVRNPSRRTSTPGTSPTHGWRTCT